MGFSHLYVNYWGGSSMTVKFVNHFQRTFVLAVFLLPGWSKWQMLQSLLPFFNGNLKTQQSPFSSVLYLKLWRGGKQETAALALCGAQYSWGLLHRVSAPLWGRCVGWDQLWDQLWLDSWNALCQGNFQPFPLLKASWLQEISQQSTKTVLSLGQAAKEGAEGERDLPRYAVGEGMFTLGWFLSCILKGYGKIPWTTSWTSKMHLKKAHIQ